MTTGKRLQATAGYLGTCATELGHANDRRGLGLVDDCMRIKSATTVIYPVQNINLNRKEKAMTKNEYNETFDMQMEREHQQTLKRMQEFRLIGEQISKMPDTPPKVLEIEVRYLMGIISELETRIKDLESEARRLEMLLTRAN